MRDTWWLCVRACLKHLPSPLPFRGLRTPPTACVPVLPVLPVLCSAMVQQPERGATGAHTRRNTHTHTQEHALGRAGTNWQHCCLLATSLDGLALSMACSWAWLTSLLVAFQRKQHA